MTANSEQIKSQVKEYWNEETCGTWASGKEKFTREYFEEIEKDRYEVSPEIKAFADFDSYKGKKLLEVGIGAGTDFLQWVRGGAVAYGIDLTEEAVRHIKHRLTLYNLNAEQIIVADCENLPFDDDFFDIVYSFGVIHHTPDTEKAMHEIIRVCRPGGRCKVMIYHRHSILTYLFWVRHALLKLRPWKSLSWVLYHHMESIGTKAYTKNEALKMLDGQPVENIRIKPVLTYYDKLGRFGKFPQICAKALAVLLGGDNAGWFLTIEFDKKKHQHSS